jgi:glutaminyl-peptide cyclotransferase
VNRKLALVLLVLSLAACSRNENVSANSAPQHPPTPPAQTSPAEAVQFDGQAAFNYTKEIVGFGQRVVGTAGYQKTQQFLREQLKGDNLEEDGFNQKTPVGLKRMTNFIAKYPGTKPGIIVVAGHYDTKPIKSFLGANDGGSSTGLPLELAKELHKQINGGKLPGYSVWVVWIDGEESIQESNDMDLSNSTFGSQHLAAKWNKDGTAKQIRAFILVDMIGDADLDVLRDTNSTPWLSDVIYNAATRLGVQNHFYAQSSAMTDDHNPFANVGVPVVDIIDFDYGPNNAYWHHPSDTMDKLSPQSFQIVGSVVLEAIRQFSSPATGTT